MGTPLGPKYYVPYAYMDPLGYIYLKLCKRSKVCGAKSSSCYWGRKLVFSSLRTT